MQDDVDHIRMIVDNNPKVPSRIKAIIEGTGESPAPILVQMGSKLQADGADFLVILCNTAHYYLNDIRSAVSIPVIDMIELTVDAVLRENPTLKTTGLLASQAVLKTGLYMKRFGEGGVNLVYPKDKLQEKLMSAIYDKMNSIEHYSTLGAALPHGISGTENTSLSAHLPDP